MKVQFLAPGLYLNPRNSDFYYQNLLSCLQSVTHKTGQDFEPTLSTGTKSQSGFCPLPLK